MFRFWTNFIQLNNCKFIWKYVVYTNLTFESFTPKEKSYMLDNTCSFGSFETWRSWTNQKLLIASNLQLSPRKYTESGHLFRRGTGGASQLYNQKQHQMLFLEQKHCKTPERNSNTERSLLRRRVVHCLPYGPQIPPASCDWSSLPQLPLWTWWVDGESRKRVAIS